MQWSLFLLILMGKWKILIEFPYRDYISLSGVCFVESYKLTVFFVMSCLLTSSVFSLFFHLIFIYLFYLHTFVFH